MQNVINEMRALEHVARELKKDLSFYLDVSCDNKWPSWMLTSLRKKLAVSVARWDAVEKMLAVVYADVMKI